MNDGFIRTLRFFIRNLCVSCSGLLAFPLIVYILRWKRDTDVVLCSVNFSMVIIVFALCMQHYIYFYKTVRAFGISGKNYLAACHVYKLLLAVVFTSLAWLTCSLINFNGFTPPMIGIVLLASISFGFMGEFCGILFYIQKTKLGIALYLTFILVFLFFVVFFSFTVFGDGIGNLTIPTDTLLLMSELVFPLLALSFFVINGFMVKNLEVQS